MLSLLLELKRDLELSSTLIALDPAEIGHAANNIPVMNLYRILDGAAAGALYEDSGCPYTEAMIRPPSTHSPVVISIYDALTPGPVV